MDGIPGWVPWFLVAWAVAIPVGGVGIVRWKNRQGAKKPPAN